MDRVRPEVANQGEPHVRCRVEYLYLYLYLYLNLCICVFVRTEVANQGEAHVRCRVEPRNRTRGSLVNGLAQISESVHCKCNLCKYTNTTDLTGVPDFLPVHIYATSANMQHCNTAKSKD